MTSTTSFFVSSNIMHGSGPMNNIEVLHKLKIKRDVRLFSTSDKSIDDFCFSCLPLRTHKNGCTSITRHGSHLIVGSNKTNQLIIKMYLERNGISVTEAEDALQTINLIKENNSYDIVWLDLQMPRINGLDCAKMLRQELGYEGPIIGLTGHVDYDTVHDCLDAGMQEVVGKPITEKALLSSIEKVCKQAEEITTVM